MKVYFTAYGQVRSFSKKEAIRILESFKDTGAWNLNTGRTLKVEAEGDHFRQGNRIKDIAARFPRLADDYAKYPDETKETIDYIIEKIKR